MGTNFSGWHLTLRELLLCVGLPLLLTDVCYWSGADFTNAVVDRVNFRQADLTNAKFRNTVVTGSQFEEAKLDGAVFEDALIGKEDVKRL